MSFALGFAHAAKFLVMEPKPTPEEHLEDVVTVLASSGFLDVVREEARQLWRANCERHEPEQLFDDSATLGFTASRNVNNAVRERVHEDDVAPSHLDEFGVRVYDVGGYAVRLFKSSGSAGRKPRLQSDFVWKNRESRMAAARRNDRFRRPLEVPGHEALFDLPPDPQSDVALLNDVFIVWGGDIESRLTAGWAGLPTARDGSWAAVERIWWDTELLTPNSRTLPGYTDAAARFGSQTVPTPLVTLRQHAGRINEE